MCRGRWWGRWLCSAWSLRASATHRTAGPRPPSLDPPRPAEPERRGRGLLGYFGRWLVTQSSPAHVLFPRLCLSMCLEETGGLVNAGLDLTCWMGSELRGQHARCQQGASASDTPKEGSPTPGRICAIAAAWGCPGWSWGQRPPSSAVCSDTYIHCSFCFLSSFGYFLIAKVELGGCIQRDVCLLGLLGWNRASDSQPQPCGCPPPAVPGWRGRDPVPVLGPAGSVSQWAPFYQGHRLR